MRCHFFMNVRFKYGLAVGLLGALACALLLWTASPLAMAGDKGNPNPGVLPPQSNAFGKSYGEWGDAWWRWILSIPTAENPLIDPTGANAGEGQSGKVWFLAGTLSSFGGGAAERTITVPAGEAIFFPIYNSVWINTPQFGDPEWSPAQEAFARAVVAEQVESFVALGCTIDGQPVQNITSYRATTPEGGATMVDLPDGNLFGVPAGTYGPMVTDGYYLLLAPSQPARIRFTSTRPTPPGFTWM
jgi:hypothetical protein